MPAAWDNCVNMDIKLNGDMHYPCLDMGHIAFWFGILDFTLAILFYQLEWESWSDMETFLNQGLEVVNAMADEVYEKERKDMVSIFYRAMDLYMQTVDDPLFIAKDLNDLIPFLGWLVTFARTDANSILEKKQALKDKALELYQKSEFSNALGNGRIVAYNREFSIQKPYAEMIINEIENCVDEVLTPNRDSCRMYSSLQL